MNLPKRGIVARWLLGLTWLGSCLVSAADRTPELNLIETGSGVEYGVWGYASESPAPVLINLGNTIEGILGSDYFRQSGNALAELGYLSVSIDIPGHGKQHWEGEPNNLSVWRHRLARGENFVEENNRRLSEVVDHLIETGLADPDRIAICGTSRGGFLALHFAAYDRRIKAVAAYAPVTDLMVLREFEGAENMPLVAKLSVVRLAERLASQAVWIIIGDRDERVGTDESIAVARAITAAVLRRGEPGEVELHVLPEPKGHTTPQGAAEMAAVWIERQIGIKTKE